MKSLKLFLLLFALCLPALQGFAGNPERTGQAGATQLLINPYGRSSGINGLNASFTRGIESSITNIAGLAHTGGTELIFAHTIWLQGTDIRINSFGFAQRFGENGGVMGISAVAFDLGDIEITTIDNPDGGIGTFSPTFLNISASYAREMVEDRIFVGASVKMVHESVPDAAATGVCFDAGVQFQNKSEKFKIGVALRNVGPTMQYSGDALTVRAQLAGDDAGFDNAVSIKAADFELPAVLLIGTSYDILIGKTDSTAAQHRITPVGQFTSNAYGYDQFGLGVEYAFKDYFMVRFSHIYEENIFDEEETRNAYTGLAGGVSVNIPFGGGRTAFGVDYSYRHTYFFNGTHTIGARLTL